MPFQYHWTARMKGAHEEVLDIWCPDRRFRAVEERADIEIPNAGGCDGLAPVRPGL